MPVSDLDGVLSIKFFILFSPLINPGQALRRFYYDRLLARLLTLYGTLRFFMNSFLLASLLSLLVGLNLSFLIGGFAWFFKIKKTSPFESVEMYRKEYILGPVPFSLFINDLPAFLPSTVSCSLYADDMAIWSSFLGASCGGDYTRSSDSSGALV